MQDGEHPLEVVTDGAVRHPVVVHDLDAPQLVVGGVYFPPEDLEKQAREDVHPVREKGKVCLVTATKMDSFFCKTESGLRGLCRGTVWTFVLKRKLRRHKGRFRQSHTLLQFKHQQAPLYQPPQTHGGILGSGGRPQWWVTLGPREAGHTTLLPTDAEGGVPGC